MLQTGQRKFLSVLRNCLIFPPFATPSRLTFISSKAHHDAPYTPSQMALSVFAHSHLSIMRATINHSTVPVSPWDRQHLSETIEQHTHTVRSHQYFPLTKHGSQVRVISHQISTYSSNSQHSSNLYMVAQPHLMIFISNKITSDVTQVMI